MTNQLPASGATPAQQINNLAKQVTRLTEKLASAKKENEELHEINTALRKERDDIIAQIEAAADPESTTEGDSDLVDG